MKKEQIKIALEFKRNFQYYKYNIYIIFCAYILSIYWKILILFLNVSFFLCKDSFFFSILRIFSNLLILYSLYELIDLYHFILLFGSSIKFKEIYIWHKLLTFQVCIYYNFEDTLHQCEKCYFEIIAFNIIYIYILNVIFYKYDQYIAIFTKLNVYLFS